MLGSAQDFCDKASKITQIKIDFSELKRTIKEIDKVIREVKVMLAEGLLCLSLAIRGPIKDTTRDCLRHVLADISGGKVDGEKVHPVLQKVAWSHVK